MTIEEMLTETNEFEVRDMLREERRKIESFDDLVAFLQKVKDECNTGYGTAPRSIAQAALATAYFLAVEFGISSFQAGRTMWDFIFDWTYRSNKCGLQIVDYDKMLYPQYNDQFEKTINKYVFESLQEEAKKLLEEHYEWTSPITISHWQSIVDGNVPFGYVVKDD